MDVLVPLQLYKVKHLPADAWTLNFDNDFESLVSESYSTFLPALCLSAAGVKRTPITRGHMHQTSNAYRGPLIKLCHSDDSCRARPDRFTLPPVVRVRRKRR